MQEETDYIISLIRNRDTKGLALLINRYQDYVFTIVCRIVKNQLIAEEVCQDVFLKIYNSITKFDGKAKFSSWIYSIAYHAAIDAYRKRKMLIIPITQEYENKSGGTSSDKNLRQAETRETLEIALQQLPAEEAGLITLYYFQELSVKELTQITHETESNIKVKMFRARKKLKKILEKYLNQEIDTLYG